jgi:hypothetical protein
MYDKSEISRTRPIKPHARVKIAAATKNRAIKIPRRKKFMKVKEFIKTTG